MGNVALRIEQAGLNYASSVPPSAPLGRDTGYLYGRFKLGSKGNPRLARDLTNLDTGEILSFAFQYEQTTAATRQIYPSRGAIDTAPAWSLQPARR